METPNLIWETGTAYDLLISLEVLHDPARFGLRGSWAAGVRSRLPGKKREFLQKSMKGSLWMVPWLASLPGDKDSTTVLEQMSSIPAADRLYELNCLSPEPVRVLLSQVQSKGGWIEADKERLRGIYQEVHRKEGKKKKIADDDLRQELDNWARAEAFGDMLLNALTAYHQVFFAEEEERIRPALDATVTRAKALAGTLSVPDLFEELSQGLRFDFDHISGMREVKLIPSYWITPLAMFTRIERQDEWMFVFGGRPSDASLVPGENVPELLQQTLKALADPTRLRIIRYLSAEPLTPAELARRLRLRAPTVLHHLDALRLARLVHVNLSHEGRRYEARREAVNTACEMLERFLDGDSIAQ